MNFPGLGLARWAAVLQGRLITDQPGEDSAVQAAEALAEVLDAEHLDRLTQRLIQLQKKNANRKERKR